MYSNVDFVSCFLEPIPPFFLYNKALIFRVQPQPQCYPITQEKVTESLVSAVTSLAQATSLLIVLEQGLRA